MKCISFRFFCLVFGLQTFLTYVHWFFTVRQLQVTHTTNKQNEGRHPLWTAHTKELSQTQATTKKTWPSVVRTDTTPRLFEDEFCYIEDGHVYEFERFQHEGPSLPDGHLGPCHYFYPTLHPPDHGYENGIDMFFFRGNAHDKRQDCFLLCMETVHLLSHTSESETAQLLIQATVLNLPRVVKRILELRPTVDPLYAPPLTNVQPWRRQGLNSIQEAIRGGYAEIVKLLSNSNNDLVIDELGRTIKDYVVMKGSPIRPDHAKSVLGIDVLPTPVEEAAPKQEDTRHYSSVGSDGWSNYTSFDVDERCQIDIVHDDLTGQAFYERYVSTGRPVLIRGQTPKEELTLFSKDRWQATEHFHSDTYVEVGPTAYPALTGQEYCSWDMSIAEIEAAKQCPEMPGVPMVHAWHPNRNDFDELFPIYNGNVHQGAWRKIQEWFGPQQQDDDNDNNNSLSWQVFFGGDASGATLHWHNAAINILYVGKKEWYISPPQFRGWTGMPAKKSTQFLDDSVFLHCTQQPGDLIFVPDFWGHMTVNHGFSIGAAALLSSSYQKFGATPPSNHRHHDTSDQSHGSADWSDQSHGSTDAGPGTQYSESGDVSSEEAKVPFLFVHINKTGGTSLIDMLNDRCRDDYVRERWSGGHRSFHATALSYIDHYGRDTWERAYTFAVVRHPLARQVSTFFFVSSMCSEEYYGDDCKDRFLPYGADLDRMTDKEKIEAFHTWIHKLYDAYPPGSPKNYLFGSRGHGNEDSDMFNSTQTSWMVDHSDNIVVDRIFHLESLSQDMSELANAIPCLKDSEDGVVEMQHANTGPSSYPHYMRFAENRRTRRIIREVFEVDFINFGYKL